MEIFDKYKKTQPEPVIINVPEEKDEKAVVNALNKKILTTLKYVGLIGAVITCVLYIIVVCVLISGFEQNATLETTVFAAVNALIGFVIMQMLKVQGIQLAKDLPQNKDVIERYYTKKTKDKKFHSIKRFWITSTIKDAFIKCAILAITSVGVVYIVVKGNNDYSLLALAIANLLMFVCFGLLSLNKAYEAYNNEHVPYMLNKLAEAEEEEKG